MRFFSCFGSFLFQFFHGVEPYGGRCVGGHPPVAARREGDAAHLRSVGQGRTFELLGEEAAEEGLHPLQNHLARIAVAEGAEGQHQQFVGGESPADEVVEEEVVQLVGTHQILGLLGDFALLVGGQQFGADRRVDHIQQGGAGRSRFAVGHPAHQMAYEGLGYRSVDAVHRHVVAIVGRPTERQLAQVARADHQTAHLVGVVHQDLRPLAGLSVLVGGRAVVGRQADVAEMLFDRGGDRDLELRDA